MALSDYVAAGYFLALPESRHEGFNDPRLIPPEVFSASAHATILPDEWCFADARAHTPATRAEDAADWGIPAERVPAIVEWAGARRGTDVYDRLCATLATARELRAIAASPDPRLALLCMALPTSEAPRHPSEAPIDSALSQGAPPESGGVILGHELLTSVGGSPNCSWLCGACEKGVHEALGIGTNANGLIESVDDALRAAAWIDESISRGEPGPWFPWLLIRYDA